MSRYSKKVSLVTVFPNRASVIIPMRHNHNLSLFTPWRSRGMSRPPRPRPAMRPRRNVPLLRRRCRAASATPTGSARKSTSIRISRRRATAAVCRPLSGSRSADSRLSFQKVCLSVRSLSVLLMSYHLRNPPPSPPTRLPKSGNSLFQVAQLVLLSCSTHFAELLNSPS